MRSGIPKYKNEILVVKFIFFWKKRIPKRNKAIDINIPGASVIEIIGRPNKRRIDGIIFLSNSKLIPAIAKIYATANFKPQNSSIALKLKQCVSFRLKIKPNWDNSPK